MVAAAKIKAADFSDQAAEHFASGKPGLFVPRSLNSIERNNNLGFAYDSLEEAFPDVDPNFSPAGSLVLVMIRQPKLRTAAGLLIDANTRKTDHDNTQVGKVIAMGPLCFKRRDTAEEWPEGTWCKVGDFVRVPKYQGDRFAVEYTRPDYEIDYDSGKRREFTVTDEVVFVSFKDTAIFGKIPNPLSVKAFI